MCDQICLDLPTTLPDRPWLAIACYLVDHGADLDAVDLRGNTPVTHIKNHAVVDLLRKRARFDGCLRPVSFVLLLHFCFVTHWRVFSVCTVSMFSLLSISACHDIFSSCWKVLWTKMYKLMLFNLLLTAAAAATMHIIWIAVKTGVVDGHLIKVPFSASVGYHGGSPTAV